MALDREKCKVVPIEELITKRLKIDDYQRPYNWQVKTVLTLFSDIKNALCKNKLNNYRIGTVILHNDTERDEYFIVDGQQRIITISLMFKCLNNYFNDRDPIQIPLLNEKIYNSENSITTNALIKNYILIKKKIAELENKEDFLNFLLKKCEFVQIVTNDLNEAFQFFDSQNHRGKALDPHVLLKAYHLRAMPKSSPDVEKIVQDWEKIYL